MFLTKAVFRTMTRRRFKSLVVAAASLALVLFMNMYAETIVRHQASLDELHDNITVTGYITSPDGSKFDDLAIKSSVIMMLEESGFIAQGLYTRNLRFMQGPWLDQTPTDNYIRIMMSPKLVGITDLAAVSSFAVDGDKLIKYLDGYGSGLFASGEKVCIVSENYLMEGNLGLGDEVQLTVAENAVKLKDSYSHGTVTLKIVGVYQSSQVNTAPAYCPWDVMTELCQELSVPLTLDSARFTLGNTQELNEFKALLRKMGFIGHNQVDDIEGIAKDRLGFIINDSLLNEATASVAGYIALSRILYPIIYLLCAGIGFIVSYLLVRLRKPEFAIMRSLGTSRAAGFLVFFLEQTVLTVIGIALGIIMTLAITRGAAAIQITTIGGYLACYLVGTALAITTLNRVNVIQILTAKE